MLEITYNMMRSKAEAVYAKKQDAIPVSTGFDPISIILAIISMIKDICKPTPTQLTQATTPTEYHRFQTQLFTRRELRERYGIGGYRKYKGEIIADTIMEMNATATEDERKMFCEDD